MRLWIIGPPGAGKSTLATAAARHLGVSYHELDAYFFGPGWEPKPTGDFVREVEAIASGEQWIIDGNYPAAGEVLKERSTILVWLDFPLYLTFPRLVRRTFRRVMKGGPMWSGNRETWANVFLSKDGILYYALRKHNRNHRRFAGFWDCFPSRRIRLTSSIELDGFLKELAGKEH